MSSSLSYCTLAQPHHRDTVAGWWCFFIHVSSSSPYSIHVVYTFLQMLFALVSLADNSLYSSTVYIFARNVLLSSAGRAQKSKQNHNKLLWCSLHDFPISPPFLLTSSHTHSLPGISLAAWPIRFPDQPIKPVTKDPIVLKFNHFLDQSLT